MTGSPAAGSLGGGWALRALPALELLQARRDAAALARDRRERPLCANACLLARALEDEKTGQPVFPDGKAVLAGLTAEEIGALAARWSAFRRANDPGLARLCPDCRSRALEARCPVCGRGDAGREAIVNPAFDPKRFSELKGGERPD